MMFAKGDIPATAVHVSGRGVRIETVSAIIIEVISGSYPLPPSRRASGMKLSLRFSETEASHDDPSRSCRVRLHIRAARRVGWRAILAPCGGDTRYPPRQPLRASAPGRGGRARHAG